MILHDPVFRMCYEKYGIMIPVSPARPARVIEYLKSAGGSQNFPGPTLSAAEALRYLGESGDFVIGLDDLERVHSKEYVSALFDDKRPEAGGLSGLEKALFSAFELIDSQGKPRRYEPEKAVQALSGIRDTIFAHAGGTYLCCRLAQASGFCFFMGGGMHHARYDGGAGFCLVNDIAIAARRMQAEGRAGLIWVLDLDAHKGDGTAELVRLARKRGELAPQAVPDGQTNLPRILTLSIHMAHGWPLDEESLASAAKDRAPLVPSDVDIGVDSGEEAGYVSRLAQGINRLETMTARPDLIIVVDGADPYEHDGLPSSALLKLSLEQCLERDRYIYHYVQERNIPSAWIEAGGYGERAWEPAAHFLAGLQN